MADLKEVIIPDIGGAADVEVIEIAVKVGDQVQAEDTLITLETDKASMDVPAPFSGTIKELKVNLGDKVSEGALIMLMETQAATETTSESKVEEPAQSSAPTEQEVRAPDLGTDDAVEVIEVSIQVGDQVDVDAGLVTLETDKASMDVPAPFAGKVKKVNVKVGDKIKQGDLVAVFETMQTTNTEKSTSATVQTETQVASVTSAATAAPVANNAQVYAGPAVRRLANQLGVDLKSVAGSGRKNRIMLDDVHAFVKRAMQSGGASAGAGLSVASAPKIDFGKFGETEVQPLSRIKKLSGANLHRNWVTVPHVTQFDEADITDLEAFRKANKARVEKQGAKLTPLVFIMKAVVASLKAHPTFNASLDSTGENLILKKYFHVGVAVDTPNGLMVPVIRNVDQKGFVDLALELGEISLRAREGKLKSNEMQGGCFSISSLGGIGGTAFTPIVNSPEVSILGVSRSEMKPKFIDGEFEPRLMLPLCLSYDHRVIDGADAARFITHLSRCLADLRQMLL